MKKNKPQKKETLPADGEKIRATYERKQHGKPGQRISSRFRNLSIRGETILMVSLLIAGAIMICWLLNFSVLGSYYQSQKLKTLKNAYTELSEAAENGEIFDEKYSDVFERLTSNGNLTIIVVSPDFSKMLTSAHDSAMAEKDIKDFIFQKYNNKTNVLYEGKYYTILRANDRRLGEKYLYLTGNLSSADGEQVLIKTPLASIKESAAISNRFLLFAGIVAIIAGVIAAWFMTNRITGPIRVLTDISQRMVDLDFETKYRRDAWKDKEWRKQRMRVSPARYLAKRKEEGKNGGAPEGNEIDQLGEHMNILSSRLEQTISELKSANAELQTDIERKTEIDEMRKEFLSNVSHELKTPLALIQGYAEGLQACVNDDQESREFYCEVIIDEADKMNRMVKKLLTLNQLEFGNEQIHMERFDITELIRGVSNSTKILRDQQGISLILSCETPEYVWGDEFKVEEVITNYMSNAINHCDGEKQIRIFYTRKDNDILRISVFNTGQQIPESDLEQIWVKFYKVDKAHTRAYGGSGIGLSIVKAIMDSLHQNCGVINHEDGVEFWLELSRK
jgi:two-component system sensor histidine kinase VanS